MTWLRTGALLLVFLVLQLALFERLAVAGVSPDLMLLLAVAAGLVVGPDRGAAVGFASGLGMDLFLTTPLGLSALAYGLTGYAAGQVHNSLAGHPPWLSAIAGFAGTLMGIGIYVIGGELLDQPHLYGDGFWRTLSIMAAYNGLLSPIVVWIVRRVLEPTIEGGPRRSALDPLVR